MERRRRGKRHGAWHCRSGGPAARTAVTDGRGGGGLNGKGGASFSYWEKRERGLFSRPLRALDARRESSEASELCTAIEDGAVGSPPSFTEAGDAYLS